MKNYNLRGHFKICILLNYMCFVIEREGEEKKKGRKKEKGRDRMWVFILFLLFLYSEPVKNGQSDQLRIRIQFILYFC